MRIEAKAMIEDRKAMTPLTAEATWKVREMKANRIIPSRWHLRRKPKEVEDGTIVVPKARWILVGFKDPDISSLLEDAYAPTPSMFVINIVLSALASLKYEIHAADLAQAFLQSDSISREIYVEQPEEGIIGIEPGVLLKLNKEVYGTVSAPSAWRKTLVKELLNMGYKQSVTDSCVFLLKKDTVESRGVVEENLSTQLAQELKEEALTGKEDDLTKFQLAADDVRKAEQKQFLPMAGLLVLLVDDLLEGGNADHRANIVALKQRFSFGKHKSLQSTPGGVMFNGRRVQQLPDYSVQCTMKDYILEKIDPIALPKQDKKRGQQNKGTEDTQVANKEFLKTGLTSSQQELMHTINMKLLWCARQARPEVLGTTTYIASTKASELTVEHLKEAAKTVKHLKQTAEMSLTLHSFIPTQVKIAVVADGSPNAKNEPRGQGGSLVAFTTEDLQHGRTAKFSPVAWRSGKLERVTASSLAAESYSMVAGLSLAEFVLQLWCECTNNNWCMDWSRQRLRQWEKGVMTDSTGIIMARSSVSNDLKQHLVITDAKSLYDGLRKDARSKEPKISLTIAELKQGLNLLNMSVRWLPHNLMMVDPFTKPLSKANVSPMLHVLQKGSFQLNSEMEHLLERRQVRDAGRYNSRLKTRGIDEDDQCE
eukprot:5141091-Amphidinium_carterae.1